MDRYEVSMDDHLAPLVEAVERGDEVVIMREGKEVARVRSLPHPRRRAAPLDISALQRLRAKTVIPGFQAADAVDAERNEHGG